MVSDAFDGKAFVRTLPTTPGVYRMYDAQEILLYVGKAVNLQRRVGSYFLRPLMEPRLASMVSQVARMEITLTRTEAEALILESQLIKALQPRYNILLRDGKGYPFLHLSTQKAFPQLKVYRGKRGQEGRYFGPFPSGEAVRDSLNLMQKAFRLRNCEDSYFSHRTRPCLQHGIGRCSAPCVGLISQADYATTVRQAEQFLDGKSHAVIEELGEQMAAQSQAMAFERAAMLRDRIAHLRAVQARVYVQGSPTDRDVIACAIQGELACVSVLFFRDGESLGTRAFYPNLPLEATEAAVIAQFLGQYYLDRAVPNELILSHRPDDQDALQEALTTHAGHPVQLLSQVRGDRAKYVSMAQHNADGALKTKLASQQTLDRRFQDLTRLLDLPQAPQRIECFDISHTQGELTVASCVAFGPEGPLKKYYRRYNIDGITPGDDYAAMNQALRRRFRPVAAGEQPGPDLLLIDGGEGQIAQAMAVLTELGLTQLPVVGVAKGPARRAGDETLLIAQTGRSIHPGSSSPGLHLVMAVRDEAHRFAITGHRKRRDKVRATSPLERLPGIGPARRKALLTAFGGLQGLQAAGVEELQQVRGIDRTLAQAVYDALHAR